MNRGPTGKMILLECKASISLKIISIHFKQDFNEKKGKFEEYESLG